MANSVFTPATNATIERLIRLGGIGGIIGGVLLAAAYLTHPSEALPETLASSSWIWVHAGFMVSLVCGIFLLLALLERYGDGTMMPSVAFAFPATGILFLAGFVLFGWQLYRVGAVERGAAILTIVGTIVFGVGLSGLLPMIVVQTGSILFGAGLAWLGMSLCRRPAS